MAFLAATMALAATDRPRHGIAMHGEPKYQPGFTQFGYVNPDAPRGGRLALAVQGSFDSLNPLIVKGTAAAGIRAHVYESLMERAYDEPFSLYGLIAETIETPDDRGYVAFTIRPEAKFSDGRPVTTDDVVFSWETLKEKGRPNHRFYYSKVARIERPDDRTVKFVFGPDGDREMPLILGLMPILPKHIFEAREFETTDFTPSIGSGPYEVESVDPGTRIVYRRDQDYWGRNLAVNRGRHNFDRIAYEYFRDANGAFEAFKKGLYDLRVEGDPTRWATGYDFAAVKDGRIVTETFETGIPSGMAAFVFNTRRKPFDDIAVRKALGLMFDFEWINKTLYHGLYTRTRSYYDGSELSAYGRPADRRERELLAPFPDAVPEAIMDGTYAVPESDGSGRNRQARRDAIALLKQAGYTLEGGVMTDSETGEPVAFEILVGTRDNERLALSYARALTRIGVKAEVRRVDSAQYQRRRQDYDFDMMPFTWFASLSPGNEQSFYWGTQGRDQPGTRNYMGTREPAIDAMIEALLAARGRAEFVSAVRALDRVLMAGHYVVPLFHLEQQWVAHWRKLQHPGETSLYGHLIDTWWVDENQ